VYGVAVVVVVVMVKDVDVLDVEAGVGPVNEETPKSASTTPLQPRKTHQNNQRPPPFILRHLYPAPTPPHTSTCDHALGYTSGIPLNVGLAKAEEIPETRRNSNPGSRTEEKYLFRGVVVYRGIALF